MKRIPQLFCLIFVIAVSSVSVTAQETNISPAKRKLIAEFVVVTKMDKQVEQITDILLASQDVLYAGAIKQMLERRTGLSQNEKDALEKELVDKAVAFSTKFRERLPAAVNYKDYIEQAVYPLYDKAFTEKELTDLVAFYKTETGQKVLFKMPQLTREAMEVAQRVLLPRITKLVEDIMAEELAAAKAPQPVKDN